MKWTKDKFDLFCAMKEEGCSIEEICNALGCERQAVYDKTKSLIKMNGGRMPKYNVKSNDKGDKAMSKYPEKNAKADAAEVWRMFDEGKSRKEIAEHFGVSVQTICNRITAGRPKVDKIGDVAAKTDDAVAELTDASAICEDAGGADESYDSGTDMDCEIIIEPSASLPDDVPNAEKSHIGSCGNFAAAQDTTPKILAIAERMIGYTRELGLCEPTHFYCDITSAREEARVSGIDGTGKVYELEFTLTEPSKTCGNV